MTRNNKYAKVITVKMFAGEPVSFIVVDDLDDALLLEHLERAMAAEDYEYCQVLTAEATFRNLSTKETLLKYFKD